MVDTEMQSKIYICSIDIGKKNFAFYIEEIDKDNLLTIQNLQKDRRYNLNGTPTLQFKEILKKVWTNGKTVLFQNNDLTKGEKDMNESEICYNMNDLLDQYSVYFDTCSTIIIEKQMSFGKKHNTMAIKLAQNCWSYFAFRYGRFKELVEFPAYYKTQIIGAPKVEKRLKNGKISFKSMDKPQRKKWSILQTVEIFEDRKDVETMRHLNSNKKKDDLSDCVTQLQAYKYIAFVDKN